MLEDSVVVFTTDNGGPAAGFGQNSASNFPLRGVSFYFKLPSFSTFRECLSIYIRKKLQIFNNCYKNVI